ncbi:MAG: hypothetical protein QOD73_3463 [Solirubrobacteraceae bacterium]|jgi:hypothetical protein|nr:hypothetical protein [Solirubrobacteraceae bacterium]
MAVRRCRDAASVVARAIAAAAAAVVSETGSPAPPWRAHHVPKSAVTVVAPSIPTGEPDATPTPTRR